MTDNDSLANQIKGLPEPPTPKAKSACVMAGHIIDHATGEAFVAVFCDGGNRLSVAGARILASHIVQWADHAEKHNTERPKDAIMRFMYKAVDMAKVWQHVPEEQVADPNKGQSYPTDWSPCEPTESGIEVSSEFAPKSPRPHIKLRRARAVKRKTTKKRARK